MRSAVQIVRVSEQGVSRPFLCLADDGARYWCKGTTSGIRTMQAEWVCDQLAVLVWAVDSSDEEDERLRVIRFAS